MIRFIKLVISNPLLQDGKKLLELMHLSKVMPNKFYNNKSKLTKSLESIKRKLQAQKHSLISVISFYKKEKRLKDEK